MRENTALAFAWLAERLDQGEGYVCVCGGGGGQLVVRPGPCHRVAHRKIAHMWERGARSQISSSHCQRRPHGACRHLSGPSSSSSPKMQQRPMSDPCFMIGQITQLLLASVRNMKSSYTSALPLQRLQACPLPHHRDPLGCWTSIGKQSCDRKWE